MDSGVSSPCLTGIDPAKAWPTVVYVQWLPEGCVNGLGSTGVTALTWSPVDGYWQFEVIPDGFYVFRCIASDPPQFEFSGQECVVISINPLIVEVPAILNAGDCDGTPPVRVTEIEP